MIENEELLYKELNDKLAEQNEKLEIICAGGIVMSHYGIRPTRDIDSFYQSNETINKLIAEIGEQYNLNTDTELWLNNSIESMNIKPDKQFCNTMYEYSNLTVLYPRVDYSICMKLFAGREQDIADVAELLKNFNVTDPKEIEKRGRFFGFAIDESLLLDAFGSAYGMQWLENYYINVIEPEYLKQMENHYAKTDDVSKYTVMPNDFEACEKPALKSIHQQITDAENDLIIKTQNKITKAKTTEYELGS